MAALYKGPTHIGSKLCEYIHSDKRKRDKTSRQIDRLVRIAGMIDIALRSADGISLRLFFHIRFIEHFPVEEGELH